MSDSDLDLLVGSLALVVLYDSDILITPVGAVEFFSVHRLSSIVRLFWPPT